MQPSKEIYRPKPMRRDPAPGGQFGGEISLTVANHRLLSQAREPDQIGLGAVKRCPVVPAAFNSDVPGQRHNPQLRDNLRRPAKRYQIARRGALWPKYASA